MGLKPDSFMQTARINLRFILLCWAVLVAVVVSTFGAQKTVDQILTLVNGDVIARSDLLWSIALDPGSPSPAGHVNSDTLRRMLEVMIDQRLVAQEAARLPSSDITQDEIEKEKTELIKHFKSGTEFRQRIESVGLTADKLDEIIRGRIQIERFVDFRFRAFIFVSEQDIQKYYDEQDAPAFRNMGRIPPPLKDRRETILTKLREDRVSEEIDRWLPTARQRAEIVTVAEP